jgi:hypothetical protein
MGDLLGSLIWGAKSGQYCVIGSGSLHLGQKMIKARQDLAKALADFLSSHGDFDCLHKERECLHELVSIIAVEENFMKQKSRNNWLNLGDGNTAFFLRWLKLGIPII